MLLGSRARAKLLGWLFSHPGERYFVRQLAGILREDPTNLSRELARLASLGLVVSASEGQQKYYRTNPASPVYSELRGLVLKTAGVGDPLRGGLSSLAARIRLAFVFGSVAAGKETPASDVDLMVVGDVTLEDVVEALMPVQEQLGREINPSIYPPAEFYERLLQGNPFLKAVIEEPKVFLIGNLDELERLASGRLAD
jgi:DNA-binding transcriptional ArsR family regulator